MQLLKSAADGPRAGRYTDFSGARRRLQKWSKNGLRGTGGAPKNPKKNETRSQKRTLDSCAMCRSVWPFCRVYSLCQWAVW